MVLAHHRGEANGGGGAQAGDVGQHGRMGQHGALAIMDGGLLGGQELGDVEPLAGGHVPLNLDVARPHRVLEDEPAVRGAEQEGGQGHRDVQDVAAAQGDAEMVENTTAGADLSEELHTAGTRVARHSGGEILCREDLPVRREVHVEERFEMQRCLLYRGYDQTERRGGNFPGFFSYSADFFCTGELQGFLTINYGDFYSFISVGFPTFTELIRTAGKPYLAEV